MRRAKIVCTLGPATASEERLIELARAGMNVARLNMSHGDYPDHLKSIEGVRAAAKAVGRPILIFADLQGPKIRLARFAEGKVELAYGAKFTITTEDCQGDVNRCGTTFKGLPGDVKPGDLILIDDGRIQLVADEVTDTEVITTVQVGGPVSNNKGINLPGVAVSVPALSDKDTADLRWALAQGVDMIAMSFVRSAADAADAHRIMAEEGRKVPIIAKIEKPQAVQNLDEIIDAFDAFMVARGDLGVELPLEEVPLVQKRIVTAARRWAKPVIVATQMLESMISAPRPTRAEASDVANAILDGADAVMLSGETSVGEFPIITVQTMARIIESTEEHGLDRIAPLGTKPRTQGGAITLAAAEVADFVGAKYVCVFTESGDTARRMSRLRMAIPMRAFTTDPAIQRRMALTWGIRSHLVEPVTFTDEFFRQVDDVLVGENLASYGDKVVVISGSPPGIAGTTNDLRVYVVGDAHQEKAPAYAQV